MPISRPLSAPTPPRNTTAPRRRAAIAGCLVVLLVLAVLMIAGGIYVWFNWKGWAASAISAAAARAVETSELPPEQKLRIKARVDALAADFKRGKVSTQQVADVAKRLAQGPLLPLAAVYVVYDRHVKPAAWPQEEKDAASRSLQRLARGLIEGKISTDKLKGVLSPVSALEPGGGTHLKDHVTDSELRLFVSAAKQEADAAEIPDEPFTANIADEIDRAIDQALGKSAADK